MFLRFEGRSQRYRGGDSFIGSSFDFGPLPPQCVNSFVLQTLSISFRTRSYVPVLFIECLGKIFGIFGKSLNAAFWLDTENRCKISEELLEFTHLNLPIKKPLTVIPVVLSILHVA